MAVAGAVILSFLGTTSSATAAGAKLCKANETPCSTDYSTGTELKLSLATGTKLKKPNGVVTNECTASTIAGKTANTGGEATPVEVSLSSLTYSGCNCSMTVLKAGRLIVENIPGTMNAKVRWTGFELKENCGILGECTMGPEVSKGIFLRGGSEAVLKFEEVVMPELSGTCLESKWTGTYSVTSPKPLYVSGSTSESISGAGVACKFELNPCTSFFGIPGPYPTGTPVTASLKAGTTSVLNAGFPVVECEEAAMNGEILDSGTSSEPIVGTWNSWTFGECNCKVKVPKAGTFSIDWTSGSNGALVLSGFEITTNCGGKECNFGSTVKEGVAVIGGGPATITATKAPVPKKSGIAECNSTSEWNAEYEVTAPEELYVSEG
jgi:hypothetical protein